MTTKKITSLLNRSWSFVVDLVLAMDADPALLLRTEINELRSEVGELRKAVLEPHPKHRDAA